MKIVISPAKSLDYSTKIPTDKVTSVIFGEESKVIHEVLKSKTASELSNLMKISTALADLNWRRNQERTFVQSESMRQAVYAFNGDVYTGLDAYSLEQAKLPILESKLRILSGLYGFLRPFDLIEPYRLEMGTKMKVGDCDNLYQFWKPIIARQLNKEMEAGEVLVNLASSEYFSAIDKKVLKARIITPEFKDYKDGKLKIISFYAKKARGMMARYIIENDIVDDYGLKGFTTGGYGYSQELSTENNFVFIR